MSLRSPPRPLWHDIYAVAAGPLLVAAVGCVEEGVMDRVSYRVTLTVYLNNFHLANLFSLAQKKRNLISYKKNFFSIVLNLTLY